MNVGEWMPRVAAATCNGCGDCVAQCPTGALGLQNGKAVLVELSKCTYCATCESVCPVGAIELPYLVLRSQ
ncbi:MAG: 4Fe-4S binding protein [Chloroflexi bacterium]|nr:4Fe-4S binding protein [Chloroflexota bacterium]